MTDDSANPDDGITRRRLIGAGAVGGLALAAGGGFAVGKADASIDPSSEKVAFYGEHQAGITTPAQDRLHFAAFDMTSGNIADLRTLMQEWTVAAARMAQGLPAGTENEDPSLPPDDTGEAMGLGPSDLTITVGFGPSLFDGRFGLADQKPAQLKEIPRLPADELDRTISDGDLCIQACAHDPQVAFHAIRNLTKIASGVAVMRWCQLGFGRTSRTGADQQTPRNLMGFKDGTNNILNDDTEALDQFVWVGDEGPEWMRGGSYLVSRRIRMLIEPWDWTFLQEQEAVIGRMKESGAPIGEKEEKDPVDFEAIGPDGNPVLAVDAHVRLSNPATNDGEKILRRGYSFTDGFDVTRGQLDAGLFFICFQKDPEKQFVRIQTQLGQNDRLNEYILHESSALFAIPTGVRAEGGYFGEGLI